MAATPVHLQRALHTLVTIPFSAYCEKARWGLDRFGVAYREALYAPGFHTLGVLREGGASSGQADAQSSRFSTPLLITRDGLKLHDSHAILKWVSDHHSLPSSSPASAAASSGSGSGRGSSGSGSCSFPSAGLFGANAAEAEEIRKLEQHYGAKLGPNTRRVAYYYGLQEDPSCYEELCLKNLPEKSMQARLFPLLRDRLLRFVIEGTGATEERSAKSLQHIRREFDTVGEHLSKRRSDHLVGESLSAADIAFASLAYPVLAVQPEEGLGCYFPSLSRFPEPYQALVSELRAHPAGMFALRLYRSHRSKRVIPRNPPLASEVSHDIYSSAEVEEDPVKRKRRGGGGGLGTGVA
jgi:glutathione S-transferase